MSTKFTCHAYTLHSTAVLQFESVTCSGPLGFFRKPVQPSASVLTKGHQINKLLTAVLCCKLLFLVIVLRTLLVDKLELKLKLHNN